MSKSKDSEINFADDIVLQEAVSDFQDDLGGELEDTLVKSLQHLLSLAGLAFF